MEQAELSLLSEMAPTRRRASATMKVARSQLALELGEPEVEDPDYLSRQIVTYLGNKRALLEPIRVAVEDVCRRVGKRHLRVLDGLAGTGIVARLFKRYSHELVVNDFEEYSRVVNTCFLTNRSSFPETAVRAAIERLNDLVDQDQVAKAGFIERLYAPADENQITASDRVFYTRENARRLDQFASLISLEEEPLRSLLLGPLLSEASIHANTAGVFKGFYKDRASGVGRFGGSGSDALRRIRGQITLAEPVLSKFEARVEVMKRDANELVENVGDFDLAYFDPPYNQHPYGSNYFMLNLLVDYVEPSDISRVLGHSDGLEEVAVLR